MRRTPSGLAVVGLLAACAASPQPAAEPEQVAPSYDRLVEEYESRLRVVMEAEDAAELANATDEQEGPTFPDLISEYVTRFRALAEAHPREEDSGKALAWIALHAWRAEDVAAVLPLLIDRFADRPYMMDVCKQLSLELNRSAHESLRAVEDVTHSTEIRTWARYCRAHQELRIAEILGKLHESSDPARQNEQRSSFQEEFLTWLDSLDAARLKREAEAALESLESSAGDLRYRDERIADLARSTLYEFRDLAIGRTAPNIEGEDVDGLAFSLDQYRGRVVVLTFWGNW